MKKIILLAILFTAVFSVKAQSDSTVVNNSDDEDVELLEEMPEYAGGEAERVKFIQKNLSYPKKARRKGIEGKVIVKFIVETDGSLSDITIAKDIGYGCGEEVVRLTKIMPKWSPGKINGKPVRVQSLMPVIFKLE